MCDSASADLSVLLGTRGYSLTVSAACASGVAAIGLGLQLTRAGPKDRLTCGGVHEDTWEYFRHFDALKVSSLRLMANEPLEGWIDVAASNSFGFGGVNTCIVLRRYTL